MMGIKSIFCQLLLVLLCLVHELTCEDKTPNEVQETIDFLKRGERLLKLDDDFRDLILMVGSTGTGKSTLTQFVAGRLSNLESVGTSNFVIKYRFPGVIGNSTTVSQTIYPLLVVDELSTAFYDCPGYDDTRNTSIEIASTYFIKKVVDHSKTLKIVLVAGYDAVKVAGSRKDFATLVDHTQNFIKNLTNYKDSIALVATKVSNEVVKINGTYQVIPDENVIRSIADFLNEYRTLLLNEEKTKYNKYALELLEILLKTSDGGKTYDKISIFRRPDEPGPLDKIESMVLGRQKVRNMIFDRMTYSMKADKDFGYTISKTSILKLIELVTEINTQIKTIIANIGQEIIIKLTSESEELGNFVVLTNRFQKVHTLISAIVGDSQKLDTKLVIQRLVEVSTSQKIPISHEHLDNIADQGRYLYFLQLFTTDKLPVNPNEWMAGLKECIDYLDGSKNWFKFLSEIYEEFSQYEYQKDVTKYNVADVNDWGTEGKAQGILITEKNVHTFIEKQKGAELIKKLNFTEFHFKVLNNVLQTTFKSKVEHKCEMENSKLTVKSTYVKMGSVNLTHCGAELKLLQIFASHTVFIDTDITTKANIVLIAPTWYVWGDRLFNLNGSDGPNGPTEAAKKGNKQSTQGTAGTPGKSGTNGHDMVGFGLHFINADRLKISSDGGKGSRGQDGGSGYVASDPDISGLKSGSGGSESGEDELRLQNYRKISDVTTGNRCNTAASMGVGYTTCDSDWILYEICGGSGGDGGKGGYGGLPGVVKIFELDVESKIKINMTQGPEGDKGKGGGNGSHPKKVNIHYGFGRTVGGFSTNPHHSWKETSREADETCAAFTNSIDGKNSDGLAEPTKSPYYDPSLPIGEYYGFVREHQRDKVERDDLLDFVEKICNNTDVLTNYSTSGFVNELNVLENQFYQLRDEIQLATYYYSLASRIERFVSRLNNSEVSMPKEQLKVFNYLYTASWGKYLTLSADESVLIIDIRQYIDTSIKTIQKVQQAARKEIIDDYRSKYRADIQTKISEANSFIDTDILPAIGDITKELDGNLDALVNETVNKRKRAAKETIDYYYQQQKLSDQMATKMIYRVLGVVGQVGSCLGPYGQAASSIIDGATQIGEGFLEDSAVKTVPTIPDGAKKALDGFSESMTKIRQNRIDALNDEIKQIQKKVAEHPDTLDDTKTAIDNLQKALDSVKSGDDPDMGLVGDIESELDKLIDNKKTLLEKESEKLSEDGKKALKAIQRISDGIKVLQRAADVYVKFKADQDKLKEVRASFEVSKSNLETLVAFEKNIYLKMWPMIRDMLKTIADIQRGAAGRSLAANVVKKWKIQSTLSETKSTMQSLTKGFENQEKIMQTFKKLDEAYTTLINIYDRIENYQDQAKLGDFIANVQSADVKNIAVTDPALQSALSQLELIITSNVLLNQYKAATDGFKHTVFPFAKYYLEQFRLPTDLQLGNESSNLVRVSISNLEALQLRLDEYNRSVINQNDGFIVKTQFDNRIQTSEPFFEWPSLSYQDTITDLLSGKRITLRADIKQGLQLNAVKFNIIDLFFRAPDAVRQIEIDKLLQNFDIKITHMGSSYYRCGSSFYMINSQSIDILYSIKKDNGEPLRVNDVYTKLKLGDILLSPYSMWAIQLESKSDDKGAFLKLSALADQIDLVLVGRGQYVRKDVPVCYGTLDDYYAEEKSTSVSAFNNVLLKL